MHKNTAMMAKTNPMLSASALRTASGTTSAHVPPRSTSKRTTLLPGNCQPPLVLRSQRKWWSRIVTRAAATSSGGKKNGGKKKDDSPYKDTVLLPSTDFSMRANSKTREPELQTWWRSEGIYEQLNKEAQRENFTLHDGPPYANGQLHLGHAMNKVLKDIIVKYKLLKGHRANFIPGWDCHGLPIELKVLQSLKSKERKGLTPMSMRGKARDFALKTIEEQATQFKRYGVWGDFENRYQTLDAEYEARQLEVFGKMFMEGHIYRGLKPVNWSPSSRTALAEAELEYPAGHKSRSIYVGMPIEEMTEKLKEAVPSGGTCSLAIWTTTPWTMPANLAIAVNEDIDYAVARMDDSDSFLVAAEDLVEKLSEKFGRKLSVVSKLKGSDLEGCKYKHPLYERVSPVVLGGDYITTESGTGLVHTAPGHGQDDFQVGQKYGLPILSPVDNAGRLTKEAGEEFEGLNVLGDANEAIIGALEREGALLLEELYEHKYPYDWRTKKPTIFRATEQWFASVDGFKKDALDAIDSVQWIPQAGVKRIRSMTSDRSDWCISRQRKWGVPIPVFYKKDSGEAVVTEETLGHVIDLVRERGSDAWFELPVEDLLPDSLKSEAANFIKGEDTMDVWFDSGSSWAGVVSARDELSYPADLYLEGSDQHRGWFQSSLLTSVAVNGCAPYKTVLTHGFVLDEKGAKMSKSLGNIIDPNNIIEGGSNQKKEPAYGADTLRLWVSSVDYSSDVLIGPSILKQTSEIYRKLRGTVRFILGNMHDFQPDSDSVPYEELPMFDKYILHQLSSVQKEVDANYESFQFSKVFQIIQRFNVVDLSQFYLDIVKDRLYIRSSDSFERRSCQTVLNHILYSILPMIAPILPHLAEDAWQSLPFEGVQKSVFLHGSSDPSPEWHLGSSTLEELSTLRNVRGEVNRVAEVARKEKLIGSSLEAKAIIYSESPKLLEILEKYLESSNGVDELRYLFICSEVQLENASMPSVEGEAVESVEIPDIGSFKVQIARADGCRCQRCWNYCESVGTYENHKEICNRCIGLVEHISVGADSIPA